MSRLVSFYGDDFTGSTDVMEALASHGLKTVLFTRLPTDREFDLYTDYDAIGLAGSSRSQSPDWMDAHLPGVFAWLKTLGARYCHYKVCSTFDSAPTIGSIGRAIDIGAHAFGQPMVPLVVGAPQLKRYSFGGNLFAGYQGTVFRIDRHPVMSRHPVTPMHEADLRVHLSKQTRRPVVLADQDWPQNGVGLVDVYDVQTQLEAGQRLLRWPGGFVAGSSGVEYALMRALVAQGHLAGPTAFEPLERRPQIIAVSGSVSPTTERQIRHGLQSGFESVSVDAVELAVTDGDACGKAVERAIRILGAGRSPIIHTAVGPESDQGAALNRLDGSRERIGAGLGKILKAVLEQTGLRRAIIAGGDTSSHALGQLDIYALTTRMPLPRTPGSPLCLARSGAAALDGLEIALKGGQVGGDDYFSSLRDGTAGQP